jgi:transposase-like protein
MILWEDLKMRIAPSVRVSPEDKRQLEAYGRGRSTPTRLVQRAKIVLLATEGKENREIAAELGIMRHTVGRWRSRFARLGLSGIEKDAPRSGRLPTLSQELVQEIARGAAGRCLWFGEVRPPLSGRDRTAGSDGRSRQH